MVFIFFNQNQHTLVTNGSSVHAVSGETDMFCLATDYVMKFCLYLFHDGGPYHIETSSLTCTANQWTGFYMIGTSVMKVMLNYVKIILLLTHFMLPVSFYT